MKLNTVTRTLIEVNLQPVWSAFFDGKELTIKGKKTMALVTYLAFEPHSHNHRDVIAALLWPDTSQANARASLRQALSQLRRQLGEAADTVLETNGSSIGFADCVLRTDADTVFDTIRDGVFEKSHQDWAANLREMLRPLDGVSNDFDDWLHGLLGKLEMQLVEVLERQFSAPNIAIEQRLRMAETVLSLDEYNEKAVQAQMACHAAMNDNATALRVYRDFFDKLDAELGGEPSPETQQLVAKIKLSGPYGPPDTIQRIERPARPAEKRKLTMVAVLPFERLGPTNISRFQVLALLEQITCHLAAFKSPGVISSNSTRHYIDNPPRISDIEHDLGAHYVVTGSITAAGPKVQLSVQMVGVDDERILWATTLALDPEALLLESVSLAEQISLAIEPSLNIAELERSEVLPLEELEPHHYVLRAKNLMFSLGRSDFSEAKRILDVVQTKHPHFGPGHTVLAEWYAINLWQGWSANADAERHHLEQHSRRAVALTPQNGRALAMWGHNKITLDRDYDSSFNLFERAVRLSPNDSETLIWTVPTLAYGGEPELALDHAERAFSLSPADPFLFRNEHFLSVAHYVNENYEEAARYGLSCFRRAPNYSSNTRATIASLVSLDRVDDARFLVEHHNSIAPEFSVETFKGNHGYRHARDRADYAQKLISAGLPD
ncbi:Bacterial transcriptional activator domain protein [Pelagimonas phthalicica]|uniref:Bacterial transcriptional activator domain protein n=2 Tax=Pelagimonas phthalicica TaxID=1037362 RepID=A0A238JCE5_9RHOB|nr:DNA-binding SARP family transcriptional activator [Pelagimonas phthalicica]SMX28391.1 Bacterial transcriptional activator domain protein [Pelagimonas phthalicica]